MKKIKNLIFDFGGVLYDIDILTAMNSFKQIGFHPDLIAEKFSDAIAKLETGAISDEEFFDFLLSCADDGTDKQVVKEIFMKVLVGLNPESFKFLLSCRANYKLFLLSNTSAMHYNYFHRQISGNQYTAEFYHCFIKEYYSYQMGLKKPDLRIFKYVIADSGLIPEETLFIDDNEENVQSAVKCGLNGFTFGGEGKWKELVRKFDIVL